MNKKTLYRLIAVVAVCLAVALVYVLMNRSTKRDVTAEELARFQAYTVDWTCVEGWDGSMSEKEFILSLCTDAGEEQIGSNIHKVYSSEVLGAYLYDCKELSEITVMDGQLYITYYAADGDMIILSYSGEGLVEKAVYDIQTDELFHELDGVSVVWSKFRNGFQWGEG